MPHWYFCSGCFFWVPWFQCEIWQVIYISNFYLLACLDLLDENAMPAEICNRDPVHKVRHFVHDRGSYMLCQVKSNCLFFRPCSCIQLTFLYLLIWSTVRRCFAFRNRMIKYCIVNTIRKPIHTFARFRIAKDHKSSHKLLNNEHNKMWRWSNQLQIEEIWKLQHIVTLILMKKM